MSRCSRSHAPDAARPSRRSRRFLWPCARKFASPPSKWALEWEGTSSLLNEIYQSLDPIAFSVGPFSVRWYGIAYVLGFICAALVLMSTAKRWRVRVDSDALITIMLCVIVGVIVGGRLGYVLFYGDGYYLQHPADIFALSKGGMSFHGGLIGALLSSPRISRIFRTSRWLTSVASGLLSGCSSVAVPTL